MPVERLSLFYPLKPYSCFQKFGESLACTPNDSTPQNRLPILGKVNGVCPAGFRELYPLLGFAGHTGLDLRAYRGQRIYASADGIVEFISTEPERGLGVDIITNTRFSMDGHGEHYAKYRNWHMLSIAVQKGQQVKAGDYIGQADNTGLTSGDHDHMELKPVEKNSNWVWYNTEQNGGFFGAIDPEPFFNGFHAQDAQMIFGVLRNIVSLYQQILNKLKGRKTV